MLNQEHAVSYEVNSVLYTLTFVSLELTRAKTLHLVKTFVTFLFQKGCFEIYLKVIWVIKVLSTSHVTYGVLFIITSSFSRTSFNTFMSISIWIAALKLMWLFAISLLSLLM